MDYLKNFIGIFLAGILLASCQKEEHKLEQFPMDFSEMTAGERSIDCTPCLDFDGCCCRLLSIQGRDSSHFAQLCNVNSIWEIGYPPYNDTFYTMGNPIPFSCVIPPSECHADSIVVQSYDLFFPNDGEQHIVPDTSGLNPHFSHGWFAGFCSQPGNMFQVCNPDTIPINLAFSCELDADYFVFELQPGECKIYRQQGCKLIECRQ